MPIHFQCANIVSYDAESETYVRCNHELSAPDADVSKFVRCPKCQARALIPAESVTLGSSSNRQISRSPSASPAAVLAAPNQPRAATDSLTISKFDAKNRCTRCGGTLGESYRCLVCGHQTILDVAPQSLDQIEVHPAGCQRWLAQMLAPGIAASHLLMAAHSFVGIITIILITTAIGLGGGAAWIVLATVGILAGLYAYIVFELRRVGRRAPATLNWWQKGGWNLVLGFYRFRKWRPSGSHATWNVLDLRGQALDDHQITSLPDITKCQVLDLEGTALTDAGLHKFQGLLGLQRLVVCNTNVTQVAVFHLQQRLPHAWIWN